MKYIKVTITKTAKSIGSEKNYETFDREIKTFETLEQAKTFLANEYGEHKKVKMYVDDMDGVSRQVGWIYCFRNKDISHNTATFFQQDWVEIRKVEETELTI